MKQLFLAAFALVALTLSAQTYWTKQYDPFPDFTDPTSNFRPEDVVICNDGGYALGGVLEFSFWRDRAFLLRMNPDGDLLWANNEELTGSADVSLACFAQAPDDGFVCVLNSPPPEMYLAKYDTDGEPVWSQLTGDNRFESIVMLSDGSFVCAGMSLASYPTDGVVARYTSSGEMMWEQVIPMHDVLIERFVALTVSNYPEPESGLLALGQIGTNSGNFIAKLDLDGNVEWSASLLSYLEGYAYDICEGAYGDVYASLQYTIEDEQRGYIERLNLEGTYQGGYMLPYETGRIWRMQSIAYDPADDFVVGLGDALEIETMAFAGLESVDHIAWETYQPEFFPALSEKAFSPHPDGGYIIAAAVMSGAYKRPTLMRANSMGEVATGDEPVPAPASRLSAYPNPFNPETTVRFELAQSGQATLEIFNIRGQRVATLADERFDAGEHSVVWRADGLSSGVYFARLRSGDAVETARLLLVK